MANDVKFGMLQQLKAEQFKKNPAILNLQKEIQSQTDIFTEAKESYEKMLNGEQNNTQAMAFSTTSISFDELEAQMNEAEEKLEQLQAAFTKESKAINSNNSDKTKDKDKIQHNNFANMMA